MGAEPSKARAQVSQPIINTILAINARGAMISMWSGETTNTRSHQMSHTTNAKNNAKSLLSSSESTCEALLTLSAALSDLMAETTEEGQDDCPVQTAILEDLRRLVSRHCQAERDVM